MDAPVQMCAHDLAARSACMSPQRLIEMSYQVL